MRINNWQWYEVLANDEWLFLEFYEFIREYIQWHAMKSIFTESVNLISDMLM